MKLVYVHAFFKKNGEPLIAGIHNPSTDTTQIFPFFIRGNEKSVYDIGRDSNRFAKLLERLLLKGYKILLSGFKEYLAGFEFPLVRECLEVYDIFLPPMKQPQDIKKGEKVLRKLLPALSLKPKYWQKVAANAAVVYQGMHNRGVLVGMMHRYPVWSQQTFSGRSKTLGYNIQGATKGDVITNPCGSPEDLQIHFDWRGADIRIAAILSGDAHLLDLSEKHDPYQTVADIINAGSRGEAVTRDECKIELLKTINSMNHRSHILDLFPRLRSWIKEARGKLDRDKPLYSVLKRRFVQLPGRKPLSVFNATMQGSIAHAMQLSIRRVWEVVGDRLLAEIHDSVIVTCPSTKQSLLATIEPVAKIMCRPFEGVLSTNPVFPVRVSVGKQWREWKEYKVFYE